MSNRARTICTAFFALLLAGCAGERLHREGLDLIKEGKNEEGLAALSSALQEEPQNASFKADYYARKEEYIARLLVLASDHRRNGRLGESEEAYKRVLLIESTNVRARTGLDELGRAQRHQEVFGVARDAFVAGDLDKAAGVLRQILSESPGDTAAIELAGKIGEARARKESLEPKLQSDGKPINLELRDANIRMAFEGIAKSTNINFIIDKDVRPDLRTTVFLKNATVEDAIDLILETGQLRKKVLNSNTIMVYANTAEKARDYEELMIRAFYLQNADANRVQNTLKTMLKVKDVVVDEKLNLVVMRDTPQAIQLAEKLVAMQDMAEPEVMLELEVLEVQRNRLTALGIQWPSQLTLTPLGSGNKGSSLTLDDLGHLSSSNVGAAVSDTVAKLKREITDANILANPRVRVRNHETAKILVGDRVPVVTTTTTATGLVSDNVQYLDVGLKLDVQPDIYLQDDVAIRVNLEVSSIVKEIAAKNGTLSYQIGTRNATTVLRLRDGETQILAGLINDQERSSASGIPLLGDLPVLGRLFSSHQDDHNKTEVVLSITPHLVRNVVRPDAWAAEFWTGTESNLRTKPLRLLPAVSASPAGVAVKNGDAPSASGGPAVAGEEQPIGFHWSGPSQVRVGDEFTLALELNSVKRMRSLPLQLSYDSTAFQVVKVEEGDFFKEREGATNFATNVSEGDGKVFVSVIRSNVDGVSGHAPVAIVTLRAIAPRPDAQIRILKAAPIMESGKSADVVLPPPQGIVVVQ
jgi:general secretion pathway protein D